MSIPCLRPGSRVLALTVLLAGCSQYPLPPIQEYTVLYSNQSSNTGAGQPGRFVITWLSPGTDGDRQVDIVPCPSNPGPNCPPTWYGPGFRTDVVQPGEQKCVHFWAPSKQVAVEFTATFPDGAVEHFYAGGPDPTWHSETAWGFNGITIAPAGTAGVQGC